MKISFTSYYNPIVPRKDGRCVYCGTTRAHRKDCEGMSRAKDGLPRDPGESQRLTTETAPRLRAAGEACPECGSTRRHKLGCSKPPKPGKSSALPPTIPAPSAPPSPVKIAPSMVAEIALPPPPLVEKVDVEEVSGAPAVTRPLAVLDSYTPVQPDLTGYRGKFIAYDDKTGEILATGPTAADCVQASAPHLNQDRYVAYRYVR